MTGRFEGAAEPRLPGELAVWMIILAELLAFGMLFLAYAYLRLQDVALFNASQATLDVTYGGINTALLITASWCVVRAIQAVKRSASTTGAGWLVGALACGAGFIGIKLAEYAVKWEAGIDLSTNTFYTFYFLLTGFHFLHVIAAMGFLAILTVQTLRGRYGPDDVNALETGGAFWHMVDLLWIVLFPLIYVMR